MSEHIGGGRHQRGLISGYMLALALVALAIAASFFLHQRATIVSLEASLKNTQESYARYVSLTNTAAQLEGQRTQLRESTLKLQAAQAEKDRDEKVSAISADRDAALERCASAPRDPLSCPPPAPAKLPQLPAIPPSKAAQGPSFMQRTLELLSGSLPTPTSYELTTPSSAAPTTPPKLKLQAK